MPTEAFRALADRWGPLFATPNHGHFAAMFWLKHRKCPECYGRGDVVDHIYATRCQGRHRQVIVRKPCPRCALNEVKQCLTMM